MGFSKSGSQREVYSDKIVPQETNKTKMLQIDNLTLHKKQLDKEEKKDPKVRRRKEIINIRQGRNK